MITVPSSLNEASFEEVLGQLTRSGPAEPLVVDCRACSYASPYGIAVLLTLSQTRAEKPQLLLPEQAKTLDAWTHCGFFRHAKEFYDLVGAVPDAQAASSIGTILELTRLAKREGDHAEESWIVERLLRLFSGMKVEGMPAIGLVKAVADWCQTVRNESPLGGWLMAQAYRYGELHGGARSVVIAVCDAGTGILRRVSSDSPGYAARGRDDAHALENVVVGPVDSGADPLTRIRVPVARLHGTLTVRRGTARIGIIPPWDDDLPRVEGLAPFPGTQLQVTVVARAASSD